jgi:hypothetical protein
MQKRDTTAQSICVVVKYLSKFWRNYKLRRLEYDYNSELEKIFIG